MNALTENVQIIERDGKPEFAVLPYIQFLQLIDDEPGFPHEVIKLEYKHKNIIKAWRLYLGMTQKDVAEKAGMTAAALSQIEKPESKPHKATLEKLAKAMNIDVCQLEE